MSSQTGQPAPPGGYLSPDGYWWWDGTNWVPAQQAGQPLPPPFPQLGYAARQPRQPLPWLRILAGTSAVVGAIATLVASIVPYGTFPDPNGGPTTTSSIFSGGFSGAGWDILEPVFAVLVGVVAASLVFIGINRVVQAVSAGALIAVGIQTMTMWAAYVGLAGTDGSVGAGGVIGIAGAALVLVAGLVALAGLFTVRPAAEAVSPGAATAATPAVAPEPAHAVEPAPGPASPEPQTP